MTVPAGSTVVPSSLDWAALQTSISGEVILPGSPGYDAARKPAIANFHNVRPQAVVRCRTPGDVAETILFARRFGVPTVARSGGHCFAGRSSSEGIVLDVSPMRAVTVSGGVATIGAGARLGEVYDALDEHGLALPAGCGPTVGIAGLTLGGGFGVLGRKYGLTCDRLLEAQVVLADGRVVVCDEHRHADLFWGLHGAGGGHFGVVTSLVFRTLPTLTATSFHLTWPSVHAGAVIGAWQCWAPAAPDEVSANLLVTAPGDPAQPPVVNLFGAVLGSASDAAGWLAGFVAEVGRDPASASLEQASYREAKRYLAALGGAMAGEAQEDPAQPSAQLSRSAFFKQPLPAEVVAALMANLQEGRVAGGSRELDFLPWGGAYNRVCADATAFVHRGERFLLQHLVVVGTGVSAAERAAARRWLARSWELARPWATGGVYPNFPDPELADEARAYHGANLERLRRIKARYDPGGFFGSRLRIGATKRLSPLPP